MRLIKVYANKDSFRPVKFNSSGLNFILAKQKNPEKNDDDGKTYNGVGKSLLVRIINFCLGADKKNYTKFCEKLEGWEFCLDFIIGTQEFTVKRSTDEPTTLFLNGEKYAINKYTNILKELCLATSNDISIPFRSIIPFFLRPSKKAYNDCMNPDNAHTDYQKLLNNAFLIGLDIKLSEKKYNLRKEQERIKGLDTNFKKDSLLRDFFTGSKDISLELTEINSQVKKMEEDLSGFQVAENYHDIQREADDINSQLFSLNNEIFIMENNIRNIEESLQTSPTGAILSTDLKKIYNEAKVVFPDSVNKTLHDIEVFYNDLTTSRVRRLSEQKNALIITIKEKNSERIKLQLKFDEKMKFLGEHQALDAFLALSQECSELKTKRKELSKYQDLQSEYKSKERQIKKELVELSEITANYLKEIEESTIDIKEYFRNLAKLFYPKNTAGLTIKTNDGENQLAFEIEARIESDASDGINNVKIFCYDLSILFKGKNHKIEFVFHDSRLFDGIDERQKSVMFKIIKDNFYDSEKQYIATINQNQLNEIKVNMNSEDYDEIFQNHIVLTLTDDNDSEKLLGIKVDIGDN